MEKNTKQKNDDKIMCALTRVMTNIDAGPHPSAEDIALLVDGSLSDSEQDRLMRHLASCRDCRELFLLTRSLSQENVEKQVRSGPAQARSIFIPYAVAATVVIAISAFLLLGRHGSRAPVSVAQAPTPVAPLSPEVSVQQKTLPKPGQPHPAKPVTSGSHEETTPKEEPDHPKFHLPLKQKDRAEGRVMVAQLELSDDMGKYLSKRAGNVVSDARGVKALVSKLGGDEPRLVDANIREVRVVRSPSVTKSFSLSPPKRAELKVQDGVLTVELMEE